jgi:hypothetical protein
MSRRRKRKKGWRPKPPLIEDQILAWADEYHRRTGRWPLLKSGAVPGNFVDRWKTIDAALRNGNRGLPGGSSLARLLAARRGVRNHKGLPRLTVAKILRWADEYHRRTGTWPQQNTKPRGIPGTNGETWLAVNAALLTGGRGLPGGSSLAQVLKEHRGVRNPGDLPPLSVEQILVWADDFHKRTGKWPKTTNWREVIPDSGGETWGYVMHALDMGLRGFPGGGSLAGLLAEHRGVRNVRRLPPLTEKQVLAWADAYLAVHGKWPMGGCPEQAIPGTWGERWNAVDQALGRGLRGLPGGSSLANLLAEHRGVRNPARLPPLTEEQILAWADAHFAAHGKWPTERGPDQVIPGTGGERWSGIEQALRKGHRGLHGGSSLARLLAKHRDASAR